jgi:AcrR family transcriptional regulator
VSSVSEWATISPVNQRKISRTGQETRDRIIDAALETVRDEGLVGTSARVIARTGDFNQALVFYHFGSVEELLLAAIERASERRVERFTPKLEAVSNLSDLVDVAVELHGDHTDADQPALAAMVAGWSATSELGPRIIEAMKPWDDLVANALRQALADTPVAALVPYEDFAHLVGSLFLGIEMMSRLDPASGRTDNLFQSLSAFATLSGPLLDRLKT